MRSRLFFLWNYLSDFRRFIRHSAVRSANNHTKLRARIIRQYHIIEKGLALRDPGATLARFDPVRLLKDLELYRDLYGLDKTTSRAYQALREGNPWLRKGELLDAHLRDRDSPPEPAAERSVIALERRRVHAAAKRDLSDFFLSRHSVRQFARGAVDQSLIEHAAYLAQRTPSVCNRQAWRIHVLDDLVMRERALQLQGGNWGFGSEADKALIITCQIGHYLKIGERNQAWVDGGMFAMSLVYALHSLGLGTCCLNWGKDRVEDLRAHQVLGIPDDEVIIMFLLVGQLPETFTVAASARKDVSELIVVHSGTGEDSA